MAMDTRASYEHLSLSLSLSLSLIVLNAASVFYLAIIIEHDNLYLCRWYVGNNSEIIAINSINASLMHFYTPVNN